MGRFTVWSWKLIHDGRGCQIVAFRTLHVHNHMSIIPRERRGKGGGAAAPPRPPEPRGRAAGAGRATRGPHAVAHRLPQHATRPGRRMTPGPSRPAALSPAVSPAEAPDAVRERQEDETSPVCPLRFLSHGLRAR